MSKLKFVVVDEGWKTPTGEVFYRELQYIPSAGDHITYKGKEYIVDHLSTNFDLNQTLPDLIVYELTNGPVHF